jgi:hypothetical protein
MLGSDELGDIGCEAGNSSSKLKECLLHSVHAGVIVARLSIEIRRSLRSVVRHDLRGIRGSRNSRCLLMRQTRDSCPRKNRLGRGRGFPKNVVQDRADDSVVSIRETNA